MPQSPSSAQDTVTLTVKRRAQGDASAEVGVVVIGRNEGDRLRRCFQSISMIGAPVVYVDSASSDQSVEIARSFNVEVMELDHSSPLGPSRARNAGLAHLLELNPALRFVQFLDGDCEMAAGWIDVAVEKLRAATQVAVVCGRLRERSPQASIYNRLCEIEWDRPVGETTACGGNCMMRVDAFQGVGGFDPTVLAAEDDEICLRLRRKGWKVFMLRQEMATHDAAMTRLRQWWRRSVRSGYAYAQGASMHGGSSEHHFARENLRAWFWGFVIPAVAIGAAWPSRGISLFLLLLYPGQLWRIYVQTRSRGLSRRDAAAYAGACTVSKFAEFVGLLRYYLKQIRRTPIHLIEHR